MNEGTQAMLLRERMAKASSGRIDSVEALTEAAHHTAAVVGAKLGVAAAPAAPAAPAVTEATLPQVGSGVHAGDVRNRLKYSMPRIDGVGAEPVVEAAADEQMYMGGGKGKKGWGLTVGTTRDGGVWVGGNVGTNSGRYGGQITVGKTGMPGATDIPGTGLSVRDGQFSSPNMTVGGLFRGDRRSRPGVELPDGPSPGPRIPSPYEGTEVTVNGVHGVIVEVYGERAAVALDSPVEGNHMIFVDLRGLAEEAVAEGSCVRCGNGITESQKFCGGCGNPLHEARSEQAAHDSAVRKLAQAGHVGKALVHAFTGMHRQGKFSNPHAISHFLKASNDVHAKMKKGHSLESAFASTFTPTRETARAAKLVGAKLKVDRGNWVTHD